ncbi:SMP-30/gluconolactonase/LRE family protein [Kitasatospora sp. NPDC054939]
MTNNQFTPVAFRRSGRVALAAVATAVLLGTAAGTVPAAAAPATGATAAAAPATAAARYPAVVNGHAPSLHPEGATWDSQHRRFLVGSLRHGTVSALAPDGSVRTLVDDPERLVSVVGIHVDAVRGRILVANGDNGVGTRSTPATQGRVAGVGAYDLETGRRLFYVDLAAVARDGGAHFANDLAIAADGTAYVTDSLAPVVYRVGVSGRASVLVRDARLTGKPGGYGLNGIVERGGQLIVAKYDDGTLWRIPLHRPSALQRIPVKAPAGVTVNLDGLLARPDGSLTGVTNHLGDTGRDAVLRLVSGDGWRTARVTSVTPSADPVPTVATPGPGGSAYVISGRIDLLFAGTPIDTFTLRRI